MRFTDFRRFFLLAFLGFLTVLMGNGCAGVHHRGSIPLSDLLYLMGNDPSHSLSGKVKSLEVRRYTPSRILPIRRYPLIAYLSAAREECLFLQCDPLEPMK